MKSTKDMRQQSSRKFCADFIGKVVIEAPKESNTIEETSKENITTSNQITFWKSVFMEDFCLVQIEVEFQESLAEFSRQYLFKAAPK